ncbi:hypothetical protein EI94DRAFT_1241572 [Lactarius quietus]|nr:hypothetical protein EI94DRAFT_1241572 [Lactarius quietus]
MDYWHVQGWPNWNTWPKAVCRWSKLRLPNGQIARSVCQEKRIASNVRRASCVEVDYYGEMRIANVEFYFYMRFGEIRHPLAMATLFSTPDMDIYSDSSETVYLCEPLQGHVVIPITAIRMVVSMFPEFTVDQTGNIATTEKFSLMRHAHQELARYPSEKLDEEDEAMEVEGVSC